MKIILLLCLLSAIICAEVCPIPQKSFYMSFPALGKRDNLINLFLQLDKKTSTYDNNYTDSGLGGNFRVKDLKPGFYYNDHHQAESYLDTLSANVSMGTISIGTSFKYEISYSDSSKNGTAFARGTLDPSFFTKNLTIQEGYLEWVPDFVPALTFTQFFSIESSTPKLTEGQLDVFNKMIDNRAGARRLKSQIINQLNQLYGPALKQNLNHQQLISSNNITYKYSNITLSFQNYAKTFKLTNDKTKGLQAYFIFGLQSNTENCTKLPTEFDQNQYGGLQQIISFGTLRSAVNQAITQGLFDVNVDTRWQVPTFQFYMGDLGNSVPYANKAPASDRFTVKCTLDKDRKARDFTVSRYDQHDILVSVPQICILNYNSSDIIEVKLDINMVVRLVGEDKYLRVVIQNAAVYGQTYRSIDQKYVVQSQSLAKYSISEVIKGLRGSTVFGTGFPALYRRYPVVEVLDDLIVLFDPSEL